MKTVGIICECNPFHGGHEYLMKKAREGGAEAVICVMSGNFVQRQYVKSPFCAKCQFGIYARCEKGYIPQQFLQLS